MPALAILGGTPVRTEPYPKWPVFDDRDVEAVARTVRSGRWGGVPFPGPNTAKFSERFAEMMGGGYAVPMVNGTITMEVALRAAGIGWGDEVIVPAYTFQATAAAPMAAGAAPVIVDINPDTYCTDPATCGSRHHRKRPGRSSSCTWLAQTDGHGRHHGHCRKA